MKKEGVLLSIILALFFVPGAFAVAGVSPGNYEIRFEPGLEKNFSFQFIFDKNIVSTISVTGDLSEYVSLDKYEILGTDVVNARISLPKIVEMPGDHVLRIIARESVNSVWGVGIVPEAIGIVKVIVPYPGKYAEARLVLEDYNLEEEIEQKLLVINRGNQSLEINPQVQIFLEESLVKKINLGKRTLLPFESHEYMFNPGVEEKGKYWAAVFVDYGEEDLAKTEGYFVVGQNNIEIINNTESIKKGNFEKFTINVRSMSVRTIQDIYGEIELGGKRFTSNSGNIGPQEIKKIELFVDSEDLSGKIDSTLSIFFGEKKVSKEISLKIIDHNKSRIYLIVLIFFLVLVFLIHKYRR